MSIRQEKLSRARLYLVCDRMAPERLERALRGGVQMVQLRMKGALDREILPVARAMRELCHVHDALFLLNDRPDLVIEVDADGVHVGQDDVPVAQARAVIGEDRLLGLSTHSPAQVSEASGVDYIGVGPVHATPTKPGRPAVGTELVSYAAAHAAVPFFAIGGLNGTNIGSVLGAGAQRVAVVRGITEAVDPQAAAESLRAALARHELTGAGVGRA